MPNSNFASVLDKPSSEIERPKPLPPGTYLCVTRGVPRYDKSSKKQTPFVEFTAYPQRYYDDVDVDALEEALTGPSGEKKNLSEIPLRITFYYESQPHRLKDFLRHLGFELSERDGDPQLADDKRSLRQLIDESQNRQVNVTLRHEPTQDGKGVQARVSDTAPVE